MNKKLGGDFVQDKPKRMEILVENIPKELIAERKWVGWKWVRESKGWTKPPLDPKTLEIASTDKPDTWGDFQTALARFKNHDADGVGYVITKEGPYTGVDFDDCRHLENGDINPEVLGEIKTLDSYTEVSPSYTGLKTLLKGKLPNKGHHNEHLGIFDFGRYFCMTGNILPIVSPKIEHRQPELLEFVKRHWAKDFGTTAPSNTTALLLEDKEIIRLTGKASNSDKFNMLMSGQWEGLYPSQSEADQALCSLLAFYTQDPDQLDRIFRQSKLALRSKWDRDNYRNRTIEKALQGVGETYTGAKVNAAIGDSTETRQDKAPIKSAGRQPSFLSVSAMESEFGKEIDWLWRDQIPKGMPVIYAGREKEGKSSNVAQISKEVALSNPNYLVMWVACEGFVTDHADKWRKLGIPDRVVMLRDNNGVYRLRLDDWRDQKFLDDALGVLKAQTGGEVAMVVIDSIRGMQSIGENDPKMAGLMGAINSIVCDKHKAACVYIGHHKKGREENKRDKLAGATGIPSSVRAVYTVERISECVCRITPSQENTLGHIASTYRSVLIEEEDGSFAISITPEIDQEEVGAVSRAEKFLIGLFREQDEFEVKSQIYDVGENQGISKRTIKRAKDRLPIKVYRKTVPGPWYWSCSLYIQKEGPLGKTSKTETEKPYNFNKGAKGAKNSGGSQENPQGCQGCQEGQGGQGDFEVVPCNKHSNSNYLSEYISDFSDNTNIYPPSVTANLGSQSSQEGDTGLEDAEGIPF